MATVSGQDFDFPSESPRWPPGQVPGQNRPCAREKRRELTYNPVFLFYFFALPHTCFRVPIAAWRHSRTPGPSAFAFGAVAMLASLLVICLIQRELGPPCQAKRKAKPSDAEEPDAAMLFHLRLLHFLGWEVRVYVHLRFPFVTLPRPRLATW